MKNKFLIFAILLVGLAVFPFFKFAQAVDCEIKTLNWGQEQAVINQTVAMQVTSTTACKGKILILKIYEEDSALLDNDIATVLGNFNTDGTSGFATYKFTQADYEKGGNETGSETMYFTAVVDGKEISGKQSSILRLLKPKGDVCKLSSAKWNVLTKQDPIISSPVQMSIAGAGCSNRGINLIIYEYDTARNDKMAETSAMFDSEGMQAVAIWTIGDEGAGDQYGSYEFFFTAGLAVGEESVESGKLLVPVNSGTGCVNCNNGVIQPPTCECYDGAKIKREALQSCMELCKPHRGDAIDGSVDGSVNPIDSLSPIGSISLNFSGFKFKIDNPFKGGAENIMDVLAILANFIFQLGIPVAVIIIIYSGILYLVSADRPVVVQKATAGLKYAAIGLTVLLVGKGFVSLIQSILGVG